MCNCDLFDREKQGVLNPNPQVASSDVSSIYSDFGYGAGVAQAAAQEIGNPKITTPPWFNIQQLAHALWFTTRASLTPIGNVE